MKHENCRPRGRHRVAGRAGLGPDAPTERQGPGEPDKDKTRCGNRGRERGRAGLPAIAGQHPGTKDPPIPGEPSAATTRRPKAAAKAHAGKRRKRLQNPRHQRNNKTRQQRHPPAPCRTRMSKKGREETTDVGNAAVFAADDPRRRIANRIVVPPMHQYSAVKGFPTDWHLMNAGKFAAGGAGLVVVESTKVERRGCGTVGDLGIWDDAFVEPLSRLVKFIKQQNRRGNPARPFRPQGARHPALGRRPAVAADARDRRLGRLVAGGAERDRAQREMAGAEGAGTPAR